MKELRAKVEDVSQRNMRYRLIRDSDPKATAAPGQTHLIAAAIFGVDDARRAAKQESQRENLVQLINQDGDELRVIAVWGTCGDIGQMTIIREAYENPVVQRNFPGRAWVRVMHPFSPKGFIQSLVNQFHTTEGVEVLLEREKTEQDLAQEFKRHVNEKRCLIVLNDLSTLEEWDQIKKCFPKNKKGSRIVVSTSQVEVASLSAGQESQVSELKQLSADQTLYAFYEKGSQNGKDPVKPTSSSDTATSISSNHAVAGGEITEDESKDANGKKVVTRIRTSVGATESELIGRETEIDKVIKFISNEDNQQSQVISVWGMGGIGKTTLVKDVYNSPKLKFDKRVFVTILRPFDLAEHLRRLIEGISEGSYTKEELLENSVSKTKKLHASMRVEDLTKELAKLLETKSCLIVLDDLSSTTEWDQIISKFPLVKTCRIIVTTREEDIAEHCTGSRKYGTVHNLKLLEPEDALLLFNKKVFGEAGDLAGQENPELIKEAEQILKKCGGLPLAIVAIGGFLAKQPKTRAEWRKLNENISAELEMNPKLGMIKTVLKKSYDGLPYELKSCFLYLAIFPEDHTITRRRLVRRWAAEGYSSKRHGKSAFEITENYFTELKNRCMILPSQESVLSRRSTDSCKVHDLIRDIAISEAEEENLVFRLEEGCGLSTHGLVRHLAISSNWRGDQHEFESIVDLSRIRSLSVFGKCKPFYISDKMRFLRVLDLEGTVGLRYHHLDSIWKLLHLKYLSLRRCGQIFLLPDSLGNLRQLQVLDVRDTNIRALPKTIIKLRKLQYIHTGRKTDYAQEVKDSLMQRCLSGACLCATCCLPIFCCCIDGPFHKALVRRDACTYACCVRFPTIVRGVDDDHKGVMVPRGTGELKDLHTLREVNVGRGNAILRDIKMLTGLRKLGVAGINKKNGLAFRSAISKLSRLESLSVISSPGEAGFCGCLDDISPPLENLQSLKLYGNLEKLPKWIMELPHLVKLKLGSIRQLEHDFIESLGKLPKLEILVLSLSWSLFQGEELYFKSPQAGIALESLRVLRLAVLTKVKSVKFEQGVMPKLEWLHFSGVVDNEFCFSGLEFLPDINEVQLCVYILFDEYETHQEYIQEDIRKRGELKKKIQEQLAGHTNQPIVTVDYFCLGHVRIFAMLPDSDL